MLMYNIDLGDGRWEKRGSGLKVRPVHTICSRRFFCVEFKAVIYESVDLTGVLRYKSQCANQPLPNRQSFAG